MLNRLKITLLLFLLTILLVTMDSAIGGKSGMIFAFIMALGINILFLLVFRQDRPENAAYAY